MSDGRNCILSNSDELRLSQAYAAKEKSFDSERGATIPLEKITSITGGKDVPESELIAQVQSELDERLNK